MGLPICQHLCNKLGGIIKVSAVKDKGSKFWFILPISASKTAVSEMRAIDEIGAIVTMENVMRGSKAEESILNRSSFNNKQINEESYESKDVELEDIYESEEG